MLARLRGWLGDITGGEAIFPLAVLFLLYFFDEFDTGAFNVLAPNIKKSFGLTDRSFGVVVVVNLGIVLLLAVPVGHWGDRMKRVLLVVIGAIVAGVFSFLTGVVTTLAGLFIVRIGNGFGRLVNDPIHTSLLTDYYKPYDRPRVYSTHRNSVQLGNILGSALAGIAAWLVGWRLAFMLLFVPIVATALAATRLKEPVRGATDEPLTEVQKENAALAPVPFLAACRMLLNVRTLRRAFWGAVVIGGGFVPLAVLLPLYLDRVYHLNEAARGLVVSLDGVATFFGILRSGRWTQRWLAKDLGEPLRWVGYALALVGVQLILLAVSPGLWFFVIVGFTASFTTGIFLAPLITVQALVSPARVRSLSFSFVSIFLVLGGALFFISPLGSISDKFGIRWGLFSAAPCWIIAGLIVTSAGKFVSQDAAKAFAPSEA